MTRRRLVEDDQALAAVLPCLEAPEAERDGMLDAPKKTERLADLAEHLGTLSGVEGSLRHPGTGRKTVGLAVLSTEAAESVGPCAEEQGRRLACRADATT